MFEGEPEQLFRTAKAWRSWLEKHHETSTVVWLVYYKKGSGKTSVTYSEALDEALCYGWIDSLIRRRDEETYKQRYTPRDPKSRWSAANKKRVARLVREGRMTVRGARAVEAAKRNGAWRRLDAVDRDHRSPRELVEALARDPEAEAGFRKMPPSARKLYNFWVDSAKRPETRARRVSETLARVKAGRRPGL